MTTSSFSAAIVGAGAIGAWIADALGRAGCEVSMLARGATLATLKTRGLRVERGGETNLSRPRSGSAAELGVHDFVFLTVKAQALPGLVASLDPLVGPSTFIVSGTNGIPWWFFQDFAGPLSNQSLQSVDPDLTQERAFARPRIVGSVVHASVRQIAPAHAQVIAADRLLLGQASGAVAPAVEALAAALRDGGINAQLSKDIRLEVWAKLWGNMNMNPVSALTRSGSQRILADDEVRGLCERMMEEMECCGEKLGLTMPMTIADRIAVTRRLGDFKTSMLADVEVGRALELAPQLGAIVEIAGRLGVDAPFSRAVLGLARLLSSRTQPTVFAV